MPTGHNLTRCLTCLREFVCGDCIEVECMECQCSRLGHLRAKGVDFCCRCGERLPREEQVARVVEPGG